MTKLMLALTLLFSAQVDAKDIIQLKADLQISVCKDSDAGYICNVDTPKNQNVEIALEQVEGEELGMANGSYQLSKTIAGVVSIANIYVSRIKDQNGSTYYLNAELITQISNKETKKQLGSVVLNDIAKLNTINWYGDDLTNQDTDLQVTVMVGSSQSSLNQFKQK